MLSLAPNKFAPATRRMSAADAGFSLTVGFKNLFDSENIQSFEDLNLCGWQIENNDLKKSSKKSVAGWKIKNIFLQSKSLDGALNGNLVLRQTNEKDRKQQLELKVY